MVCLQFVVELSVDNCCSSGGSPTSDWASGGSGKVNRGRKENARDRGNTRSKTYAPLIGCSLGNSESSQVSEKEWGEGALILTLESPPSAVLSGRESEDSKLATTPEHTPAPQLAVASSPGNAPLLPQCELPPLSSPLAKPTQPVGGNADYLPLHRPKEASETDFYVKNLHLLQTLPELQS
ncbi:hypothetical protein FOZ61_006494 [Perkinsus olseni]|uniref:Uncharacterized protein n=1 Tax=Perkinsus olseni TaxID=32597 RepID=A0A7J6LCZ9_PEROL|nr:hypothetical protein FOZ61_006494 [Perkinsus olseni]